MRESISLFTEDLSHEKEKSNSSFFSQTLGNKLFHPQSEYSEAY
jgi:hypothetical protein